MSQKPSTRTTHVDTAKRVCGRANKMIKDSGEPETIVRRVANAVVHAFYLLEVEHASKTDEARKQKIEQALTDVCDELEFRFKGISPKQVDRGMVLGANALKQSWSVQLKTCSFVKASLFLQRATAAQLKGMASTTEVTPLGTTDARPITFVAGKPKEPLRRTRRGQRHDKRIARAA